MESAKQIVLSDGTEISIDTNRRYTTFLRVRNGPARVEFSLTAAGALHDLLGEYFDGPPAVEVSTLSREEPIVLPAGHISEAAAEVFDGTFDRLRLADAA